MISSVELDERIGKCQKILEVDPNSQIFAALAEAYRKKGELDKAFRICQNGLKIHPSYGSAHVVMAKINLDRGLYDWAEVEARKAAEVDGMTRTNELLLAEIYIYKGDFNRAIAMLKKLSLADPNSSQITKLLEIAQRIPEEQARITGISPHHDDTVTAVGTRPSRTTDVDQPDKLLSSKDLLGKAIRIPGIDGALFINHEGLVIDSEWVLKMDSTACGATLGAIGSALSTELVKSSFGNFQAVLIETANVTFYLIKKFDGLFLFVANESANLGTLRMKLENLLVSYR